MTTQTHTMEMKFTFTAETYTTDYGVSGSPEWEGIGDTHFASLEWNGVTYDYANLVMDFGQHGADAILQIGRDNLEDGNWE